MLSLPFLRVPRVVRARVVRTAAIVPLLAVASKAVRAQSISVSGNPPLMRVTTAMAGNQPTSVTTATTTYTILIFGGASGRRITGQLLSPLPAGTTLAVALAAPNGATSLGSVELDLTEKDLVVNIPSFAITSKAITYTFAVVASGGVIANSNRQVRFRVR